VASPGPGGVGLEELAECDVCHEVCCRLSRREVGQPRRDVAQGEWFVGLSGTWSMGHKGPMSGDTPGHKGPMSGDTPGHKGPMSGDMPGHKGPMMVSCGRSGCRGGRR
jgi:hypothetical protein